MLIPEGLAGRSGGGGALILPGSCTRGLDEQAGRHYLAAIPEGEIAARGSALQKEFAARYGVYREPYPPLHLTVAVLYFPPAHLAAVREALSAAVAPFLPLALQTASESCFPAPFKSINFAVVRSEALVKLSARAGEAAASAGFTAESFEYWDYHISLVNCNYAVREWSEAEYQEACLRLAREKLQLKGWARRLELWDPSFPPLKVLAVFEKARAPAGG